MTRLFGDPLVRFLALGAGIFLLFQWLGRNGGLDEGRILVDDAALRDFVQYRTQDFDAGATERRIARMTTLEVEQAVADLIREEALHRRAQALGLGERDYVIRRRLVQKMEFIAEGAAADLALPPGLAERHYAERREDYYQQPAITFAHVHFSRRLHGAAAARTLALAKLAALNRQGASFAAATAHGDRFLYHVNYVERPPEFVSSHFGPAMAKQLFALPPDPGRWRGPFESQHGFHLVLVTDSRPGRFPDFAEVAQQVAHDARRALVRERTEAAIQAIVAAYDVEIRLTGAGERPAG